MNWAIGNRPSAQAFTQRCQSEEGAFKNRTQIFGVGWKG